MKFVAGETGALGDFVAFLQIDWTITWEIKKPFFNQKEKTWKAKNATLFFLIRAENQLLRWNKQDKRLLTSEKEKEKCSSCL